NTPYQGSIAKLCCTWLAIAEMLGLVRVPALTPEASQVRAIDPTKTIANKNLRRFPCIFMEALLSAASLGHYYLCPHFLRCRVISKGILDTTVDERFRTHGVILVAWQMLWD